MKRWEALIRKLDFLDKVPYHYLHPVWEIIKQIELDIPEPEIGSIVWAVEQAMSGKKVVTPVGEEIRPNNVNPHWLSFIQDGGCWTLSKHGWYLEEEAPKSTTPIHDVW